ncbi:E3 ubiquitin-protein ligase SHPRH [Galdieria sulphuraria]|nr:E3 ubiquitin-protein ligase SHPRH [Galdieria sulphuraria]
MTTPSNRKRKRVTRKAGPVFTSFCEISEDQIDVGEGPWCLLWPFMREVQGTDDQLQTMSLANLYYCGEQTLEGRFWRVSIDSNESRERTEDFAIKIWEGVSTQESEKSLISVNCSFFVKSSHRTNFYTYSGEVILCDRLAKAIRYLADNHFLAARVVTYSLYDEDLTFPERSCFRVEFYFTEKLFLNAPKSATEYRKLSVFTHVRILMSWLHSDISTFTLFSEAFCCQDAHLILDSLWFNRVCETIQLERQKSSSNLWELERSQMTLLEQQEEMSTMNMNGEESNPLWFPMFSKNSDSNISFFYNPCTGQVSKKSFEPFMDIRGGILADEMGLGKTVEVLSLIILTLTKRKEVTSLEKPERVFWGGNLDSFSDKDKVEAFSFVTSTQNVEKCSCCQELTVNDHVPEEFHSLFVRCDECGKVEHAWCANYRFERAIRVLQASPHLCYQCEADYKSQKVLQSHATLIVCPSAILGQWEEEIERNTKTVIYHYTYRGMKESGYVPARTLAEMDIVLTTYEALRNDLNRVDLGSGPSLRYAKVFRAVPTPLCRIEWFRICLDEAQIVEGGSSGAADMAQYLSGTRRWCVTGTPIHKDMSDFYGLLKFLQVVPFQDHFWWNRFVWKPALFGNDQNLRRLVDRLVWRNTKNIVHNELNLPPQSTLKVILSFGPIERHFYDRQYELCVEEASRLLFSQGKFQNGVSSLEDFSKDSVMGEKLFFRLLRLRQACCHPQVGSDGIRVLQKSTMTMQEVLEALVQRRTVEVSEAQRSYIASMNGLAALHILQENLIKAVDIYRNVLRFAKENEEHVTMDSLQKLHVLHNLSQVLEMIESKIDDKSQSSKDNNLNSYKAVGRTLEESEYKTEMQELEARYTSEKLAKLSKAKASYEASKMSSEELIAKRATIPWWMEVLAEMVANNKSLEEQIMEQIRSQLLYSSQGVFTETSIVSRFHSLEGLQYVLMNELEKRDRCRLELLETLENLPGARTPTTSEIMASGNCRYCRVEGDGPACCHCIAKEKFLAYERSLFLVRMINIGRKCNTSHGRYGVISEGDEGARLQSEIEKILKIIKSCIRRHYRKRFSWLKDMERHFQEVEALKEEFRECHVYFEAQHDFLSALDELEMSKMRISLKISDQDQKRKNVDSYQISPSQVGSLFMQFEHDRSLAEVDFQHKRSQLLFLKRLRAEQESCNQEGKEDDTVRMQPCPVCWRELEAQIVILPCGHRFCAECVSHMVQQRISEQVEIQKKSESEQYISCPSCRVSVIVNELCYIERKSEDESCIRKIERICSIDGNRMEEGAENWTTQQFYSLWKSLQGDSVRDSFGTKISAFAIYLKMIIERDTDAKCIVFSEWNDVLEIVSRALERMNVVFTRTEQRRGKSFETVLRKFRTNFEIRVLLLPVRSGSNGLNLTEATHVFLIEPLLTDSLEAQAIGRVHRIGQKKPTFVHRFLIENTIEEKVDELRRKKRASSIQNNSKALNVRGSRTMAAEEVLTVQDLYLLFPSEQQQYTVDSR